MKSLNGLRVIITRPLHQGNALAARIQTYGGIVHYFPTLEIVDVSNTKPLDRLIKQIVDYDRIIFTSPNSVFKIEKYIHKQYTHWPHKTKVIALGPGTAAALKQHALPVDDCPKENVSSEGLLKLPLLQNISHKKILILKGKGGRLYLTKKLKNKGAQVNTLSVYKRQLPVVDKKNIPDQKTNNIILCTSCTGIKNLVTLLYPTWKEVLLESQLLVISPRIARHAGGLGFINPPLIADKASDGAILKTLFSWWEKSLWNHNRMNLPPN